MTEQNGPLSVEPTMKVDIALRGLGLEIGRLAAQA
jgi:hypothetical protein